MAGLLAVQAYWVTRMWRLQERDFDQRVRQALLETARDLARLGLFVLEETNLIQQVQSNYYVVNINNQFDEASLEFYLQKAFENQGLREDFQYGIFDCSSNQMVSGRLVKYRQRNAKDAQSQIEIPLPAHHDSDFIYYFGVHFPNKEATLLANMGTAIAFTVLVLLAVVFFIYAMFVILRQKQLSELQRDFINNMTHEFKTPISTINISTDVFLQSPMVRADERLYRYASIIKEQITRLNTQVEKVLQLAKLERDGVKLNLEEIDLADFIKGLQASLALKAEERKGTLQLKLYSDHAWVHADRLHLTNVLHNLVDNGVKYSKQAPKIEVELFAHDGHASIAVKDHGIGIAPEHKKHIFRKFYRVPTGNVHNVKGFGLGLYYVHSVCKEHKWKLMVESEPGVGTTVSIRMPLVNGHA